MKTEELSKGAESMLQELRDGNIAVTLGTSEQEVQAIRELVAKNIAEIKKEKSSALIIGLKE